jgi:DNA-directed RNA polymerase subunit H (RpoH/RPB5)
MAGAEGENDDLKFVMTCLKRTAEKLPKPNYDEVAKEIGAKNGTAW